jgi:hypothetical protein
MGTILSRSVMRSRQVSPSKNRAVRNPNRAAWLWAIGNSLKAEYDVIATPLPSRLAALVEQLETQNEERKIAAYSFHRPPGSPVAARAATDHAAVPPMSAPKRASVSRSPDSAPAAVFTK